MPGLLQFSYIDYKKKETSAKRETTTYEMNAPNVLIIITFLIGALYVVWFIFTIIYFICVYIKRTFCKLHARISQPPHVQFMGCLLTRSTLIHIILMYYFINMKRYQDLKRMTLLSL